MNISAACLRCARRAWARRPFSRAAAVLSMTLLWMVASVAQKPTPPVDVVISVGDEGLKLGGSPTITLSITPRESIARARVHFETDSPYVTLLNRQDGRLTGLAPGQTYTVTAPIQLTGEGKSEVRGWVYSEDENGTMLFGRSQALCLIVTPAQVLAGNTNYEDLEIKDLQKKRAAKTLTGAQYDAQIQRIVGGKCRETHTPGAVPKVVPSGKAANKGTTSVYGYVYWTDSGGSTHAARYVTVELRDQTGAGPDSVVVSTTTADYSGYYYFYGVDNTDPDGDGTLDVIIRAYADNSRTRVMNNATTKTYFIESSVMPNVTDGAYNSINLTANNTDNPQRAFCVEDALVTITDAVNWLTGFLAKIDVDFPTTDDTSNFSGGALHILEGDWPDWDVIHHEYGHYFMKEKSIEANPGGDHGLGENLAERLGKDEGVRLAWGEGFPTYFGTSGQLSQNASGLGVPNVGDTYYTDTIDTAINYDLEGSAGATSKGEDNEISVQRILWDLYDTPPDMRDRVNLGIYSVLSAATSVNATTLSAYWNGLLAQIGADMRQKVACGCIFGDHKVAPDPKSPVDGAPFSAADSPPTFTWDANGGGPSHRNKKFKVQFWKEDYSSMIFESAELNSATYTPTAGDWNTIITGDKIVRWIVTGRNTDAPETGTYISCSRKLNAADIAFVIDDTGSMSEEIGGVRAALTGLISLFGASGSGVTINLMTFKDDVTQRITSNDLPAVQAIVDTLFASGGGDCPEASVEALSVAGDNLKPGGVAFLATDADPHSGLDIPATIAKLRARGIRVIVLLSGSCSESYKLAGGRTGAASLNCADCDNQIGGGTVSKSTGGAISVFSEIAADTGGIFAFVPGVNSGDPSGATQYQNTALNVMKASSLPSIPSLTPANGHRGTTFTLTVNGANTNFNNTSALTFSGNGITVNSGAATSPISYTANVTVDAGADLTFRDVTVTTSLAKSLQEVAVGSGAFEVKDIVSSPTIIGVNPAQGVLGSTLDVDIYGAGTSFSVASVASFSGVGITVNTTTFVSTTHVVANVTIDSQDTAKGFRDVSVTTSSEYAYESVPGPFLVTGIPLGGIPKLVSVTPHSAGPGMIVNVNVVGENTNFVDGVSVGSVGGGGVTVLTTGVTDSTHATLGLQIHPDAVAGFRDVYVTTNDEVAAILSALQLSGQAPTANAGPDQIINTELASVDVNLDGSGSVAYGGTTITEYLWSGAPDPNDVVNPSLKLSLGAYTFTLVVTDSETKSSGADTVRVTVKRPADIDADQQVNAVDVQLVINKALNIDIPYNADVNNDSVVNAVDVQTVINTALGLK